MVESKHKSTPASISLISGGIAGGVEGFLTYPFELAKTRLQLTKRLPKNSTATPTSRNPYAIILRIYQREGLRSLYKGCPALVFGSVGKDGVRFLTFDSVKNAFRDPETGALSPARNMLAGMAAGVVASIFAVTPTERIKTALIDDAMSHQSTPNHKPKYKSSIHCVRSIIAEDGFRGLYRGLVGTTLKQASATSFRMGSYNIVKDAEEKRGVRQGPVVNFANGAVAGVVTTLATMPFDTIKTRSQSAKVTTTMQAITAVWSEGGVRAFWRGTVMRLSRTVFSGGILFTTAEMVAKVLRPIMGVSEEP